MKKNLVLLTLLAALGGAHVPAAAGAATLDPSFGNGGIAGQGLGISDWNEAGIAVASAGGGSTVIATKQRLLRYLPNGKPDPSFGLSGILYLEQVEGLRLQIEDVAIDHEGRIVAFGFAEDLSTSTGIPAYGHRFVHPTYAAVLRFDRWGNIDSTFGGGDGIVRTDLGLPRTLPAEGGPPPSLVRPVAGAIDPANRPVFVAGTFEHLPTYPRSSLGWANRLVVRLTPTGEQDPTFDGDGVSVLQTIGNRGLSLSRAGDPLVWGRFVSYEPEPERLKITSLVSNGTLSPDFGASGIRNIGSGGDVALDRAGRLLVLDRPEEKPFRVFRLEPSGKLDRDFGRGGWAVVKAPGRRAAINSLVLDRRGRVLLIGASGPPATEQAWPVPPGRTLLVSRLTASGVTEGNFGRAGWLRTSFRRARFAFPKEGGGPKGVLDNRGGLVVAMSSSHGTGGIALARYLLGR